MQLPRGSACLPFSVQLSFFSAPALLDRRADLAAPCTLQAGPVTSGSALAVSGVVGVSRVWINSLVDGGIGFLSDFNLHRREIVWREFRAGKITAHDLPSGPYDTMTYIALV